MEADKRKQALAAAQQEKEHQVRFGNAKASLEQKIGSNKPEVLSPKAAKNATKSTGRDRSGTLEAREKAASAYTGLGAERFEGAGATTKEEQRQEAIQLDKKLSAEISQTSKKLEEKTRAKEKLATMSEEEIVAQAMGMTVKEYKQMMGIN